jgi:hypothetical protein
LLVYGIPVAGVADLSGVGNGVQEDGSMVAKSYPDELRPAFDNEVAELFLLLPAWQVSALEQMAQDEGVTLAQLLRRMVNDTLMQTAPNEAGYYYG